ncbi:MAG: inosine/xanthosine triphosphatase [Conexivisphaerales archaeon]
MQKILVAVGSSNKVKVRATSEAFSKFFDCEVEGVDVSSGVNEQPFEDETFIGAKNRAVSAIKSLKADFGVGIEGGITTISGRGLGFAAVYLIDRRGRESMASSGMFPLPEEAMELVKQGKELGEAMDILTGLKDTKRGLGAVGLLTKGVIDRTALYRDAVVFALIPFINSNYSWYARRC